MSGFYDKYLLAENNQKPVSPDSSSINVLKKDFTMEYSDYERLKISEQYNKLYSSIFQKNKDEISLSENKKIYNLSLSDLIKKSSTVYIEIINGISIYFSEDQKERDINTLLLIFTKGENMLYIGLLFLVIAFFMWVISITS
jgi:hypothetical protein